MKKELIENVKNAEGTLCSALCYLAEAHIKNLKKKFEYEMDYRIADNKIIINMFNIPDALLKAVKEKAIATIEKYDHSEYKPRLDAHSVTYTSIYYPAMRLQ